MRLRNELSRTTSTRDHVFPKPRCVTACHRVQATPVIPGVFVGTYGSNEVHASEVVQQCHDTITRESETPRDQGGNKTAAAIPPYAANKPPSGPHECYVQCHFIIVCRALQVSRGNEGNRTINFAALARRPNPHHLVDSNRLLFSAPSHLHDHR